MAPAFLCTLCHIYNYNMAKAATSAIEAGLKQTMFDVFGNITHGSKIMRGTLYQRVIEKSAKKKYEEVLTEQKIETITSNPEIKKIMNSTCTHQVDIIGLNHTEKICDMFDSKSPATNHNETPGSVKAMMEATKRGAEKRWPGYKVNYSFIRPGGNSEKIFKKLGIKSFDTSEYIGRDISEAVEEEYKALIAEKTEDAVEKFGLSKSERIWVKKLVKRMISTEL